MSENKFCVESTFTHFAPTLKERTTIRVDPSAWEWMMAVRAKTGIPVTRLVTMMVDFCDENLEIVPKGGKEPVPLLVRERPVEELLAEAAALLQEVSQRLQDKKGAGTK
ncbi:MAG: hypothetical protein ACOX83_12215 [Candidatus Spyradocola sp.]|jgi:hypothetical protein